MADWLVAIASFFAGGVVASLAVRADHGRLAERLRCETELRATAEAKLAEDQKAAAEKLPLIGKAEAALTDAFKAPSAEALKSDNRAFLDLALATLEKHQEAAKGDLEARKKAVDELVQPLRESLQRVDGKLGEIEKARIGAYAALNEQLKGLVETHRHSETANLVKALRQPAVRGRWGEIQLKRVVEIAGMLEHCDFTERESRTTEDGRVRPDLIVRLPGGKRIVVDSKAPIGAYLAALETSGFARALCALNYSVQRRKVARVGSTRPRRRSSTSCRRFNKSRALHARLFVRRLPADSRNGSSGEGTR